MALSGFYVLLFPLDHVLPKAGLLHGLLVVLSIPFMLLAFLVLNLANAVGVHNDWCQMVVLWVTTLPLSYGYAWVGSALSRVVRRRESS